MDQQLFIQHMLYQVVVSPVLVFVVAPITTCQRYTALGSTFLFRDFLCGLTTRIGLLPPFQSYRNLNPFIFHISLTDTPPYFTPLQLLNSLKQQFNAKL